MGKTLILCDSACDLSPEIESQNPMKILNISIEIKGKIFRDRADIDSAGIYRALEECGDELPHTSQVTIIEYIEAYAAAAREGYSDVVCICINAKGSSTFASAKQAVNLFFDEMPEFRKKIEIHCVDSMTYSLGIGWGALLACQMVREDKPADEIVEFLKDHYQRQVTMIGLYTLTQAKRSGRLNSTVAFVGEMLGLKPIMTIAGENKVIDKVRGEKNLIPRMVELYQKMAERVDGDYCVAFGDEPGRGEELEQALAAAGAGNCFGKFPVGPCVAVNSGPKVVGMAFRVKK